MTRLIIREVSDYPGHFEYVYDGRESFSYYDSREQAIDAYFSPYAWPGGAAIAYFAEGGACVLCAKCAKQDFLDSETGEAWDGYPEDGDPSSTGVMCDGCNEWIVEPVCRECYDELETVKSPVFWSESGESAVCAHCMAQLCGKGEASKIGKLTFNVSGPWYASYQTYFRA
jgi:hypothetical protein